MTKEEQIEMYFDAITAAIQNRCYSTLRGAMRLKQQVQNDLDMIESFLGEPEQHLDKTVLESLN